MKPSEFMKSKKFISHEIYIKNLDSRFIDREELKDKINNILNEFAKATDVDGRETLYKYTDCDLADLKEDLLEMLK